MSRRETEPSQKLRDLIAEYPQRSFAIAALSGFAVGGGLSSRTSFQIILMALEAVVGDLLIPAPMSGNGRHSSGNGMDTNERRRSRNRK